MIRRSARASFAMAIAIALALAVIRAANAAEYINHEAPVPPTATEARGPLDAAFDAPEAETRVLARRLQARLAKRGDFLANATAKLELRSYYFNRRNPGDDEARATVTGGRLTFDSGDWNGLGIGLSYYNSTELSQTGSDTGLLASGGDNISVLGEANIRYRFNDGFLDGSEIKLYRQQLNLPYLNKADIRRLPAVHEAYTLSRIGARSFDYGIGYIRQFKNFDSKDFIRIGEAAGAPGSDAGLSLAGARVHFTDTTSVGAVTLYAHDSFNTFFTEAVHARQLTETVDLKLQGQFTDQRSVGRQDIGEFDTWHYAMKASSGWRGGVVSLAYTDTGEGAAVRKPFGSSPSYNSIQRLDFDRAGERSLALGLSYNSAYASALGLSGFATIARGVDAVDPATGMDLPDRSEYDLNIDFPPPRGPLQGLWLRTRYNFVDVDGEGARHDVRVILNYEVPVLLGS